MGSTGDASVLLLEESIQESVDEEVVPFDELWSTSVDDSGTTGPVP